MYREFRKYKTEKCRKFQMLNFKASRIALPLLKIGAILLDFVLNSVK